MLTITDRVRRWVLDHPFHSQFLDQGLMNASALARLIKPELEQQAGEILSLQAITLAINRLTPGQAAIQMLDFKAFIGEVSVQSGVSSLTIAQVDLDVQDFFKAVRQMHERQDYTIYTRGVWHTALIGKRQVIAELAAHFERAILTHDLIAVTVKLKPGHLPVPGVCAYILVRIAQRGINLNEVNSSHDEMTLIIHKRYTQAVIDCLL